MNVDVITKLIKKNLSISSMESCTGGLLASTITDVSGASAIFPGSLVTYSNEAKIKSGVLENIINEYGVYSANTAEAMAKASCEYFDTKIGVGITGTLDRVDPNNGDSISGIVYYSIRYLDKYYNCELQVPCDLNNRHDKKEYVVNEILKSIKNYILFD